MEKCTAEEIKKTGEDKENLLHTIIGSSQLDLLRFLPSASSSSKGSAYSKNVLKAFLEKNAQNKTPLDLALTSGEQHTSALLSFVNSSLKDSEIERLIGSENIVQTAIERGNTLLLGWIFDAESRYNSLVLPSGKKKKGKSSSKQLHVLGNRNYELSLLRDACKSQNPDIAPFLLRKINERIQSSSIDEEEASANISKLSKQTLAYLVAHNTYHPAVYSNLMELSQAQDPTKNEFFLKGAWQHDNADLIKHIPYQDVAQHLDKSALIKSRKDNLLLYCLENSTPTELENIGQDLKKALAQSKDKMKKSGEFYSAWCADAALPPVLSEATLHSAISSGDLNRVKDLIAMDPTLIAKSQAGTAETRDDSSLLPYDFAVKKWANSKKHSGLVKYLAEQSIDFALSEATADRGIAGVRADQLISQEDWENFSHTVTKILVTRGADLELDSMQLANLNAHLRSSTSKLFEKSDAASPSLLRTSLSSPKNYLVTSALLKHYLVHQEQLQQELNPSEMEKIERQVVNEINKVENGYSLLHLAALNGSYDTLNTLLALGGDKNVLTPHGQNIAHLTAKSGMLTPTDGELVFEKLVRENPELNTKDKAGKGILYHAASCVHPERTVAMLERIIASATGDTEDKSADRVILDANLKKYAKNSKKRDEFIKNELNRIDRSRPDNVLSDFLDEHFRDGSMTAAEHALNQLRKITSSSQKSDKKLLPHALERTSERSFTEINPIAGAVPYMSKGRHLLLEQQKELFSICNQETLSGQGRDMLRYVPIEAFTSLNPDYGFSPLDAAIERENIPFIREILENRAEELPLNITNQNGDNLVIQLGRMLENPAILQDKEFLELYENLLDKSGCSTRSESGIKAQYVLRNIGGVAGAELRNIADRAEHREVEIGEKFSDAINKVMEEASPNAVQHLSTLTRVYPNHARNAANPFAALLSNILLDKNTETNGISDNARRAIAAFLRDNTLRDTLKNVDAQGNNPLQSALKALVAEVGSPEIGQQRATALLEVCSDVASALEKKHKDLLEEVFLKHKNHEGENFIESLTDVSPSFDIFRTLETKLTPEKISEHSDLNTILARSANQASLQNHICKNYSVFPIGDSDYRGKSRIHKAAVSGDHDAFMSVMVTGGNINLLDQDGNTPLHALLIHMLRNKDSNNIKPGHIETLKTLVAHGAPLHLKNKEGFSVCDLAKSIEHLPSPVKRSMFSFRRKKEDSCVDLVAQAHLQYHDLKEDVKKKVESNITWPSGIEKSTLSFCDLSGSKVALKIGAGGVLTSSKLLQSKVFKENALSSANFDFGDGKDLGSVEKVGNKRNYTVQKGSIKLELSWKPSEGKTQKVQVDVLADGTVKVNDESIRECGAQGEKLNFNNCQVYIGGYSLAEALQRGRWREANQEIETPSPDIDPDGREHGLDRSPSPGNDERRELGAAALDDSIPYTSIPGSDGTALPSHAPSSRTSSISSTTGAGDDDYPSASAGRGQVITVEAEVYDEEGRPIPAARGRDLGPRGGDGGASGRTTPIDEVPGQDGSVGDITPERPIPAARGRDLGPRGGDGGGARRTTPREPDAPDSGDDDYPAASAGRGQVITVEAEVYDEEGRPIPAARGRDLGPHGDDGGASDRGITTPIDGEGAVEPTPTITFPEDYDVADAEQRLAMPPIRGFVPLPTILSESEDESSSLGSQYNSDSEPYTSIPGSDGTALSSHAPSSRTSSISSTTDAGDDDYPSASAGRGQVITAEAEVYDKEGRPIPAVRGRDLGKRGDDGGASDRGIAAPIDGVPGQDGGTEGKTPQEPATTAPAPIDIAAGDGSAREIASTIDRSGPDVGVAPIIDGVPGQDGGSEGKTPQEPAALDRSSILPVVPSSSTSRSPAVTQESVNLQKWHSILRMGMHAGCQFAMDLGNENDIGAIAQKCAEKYSALAKREDLQDPATRQAALKKEMHDVLGEFGIPNIPLNHGKLTIKNGNVQGLEDTMHFSSPYGFGEKIDGMIQAALRDVNEVARRANLNCKIRPNILSLPRIALAVNNMKEPRKGLALPSLGGNDDTPIPYRDAIKFLEGVSNLAMLEEKPKIVKESSISPDDPEARKVSRLVKYFSALANEEEGATAASIPHGTVQQNMLSDDDIEALRSTIEVIDAERELVSQRQQMLHADLEAVLTKPVQESAPSYDSIASTKSDTSIESADGASGDASYKPHFAAPAVHGEATSGRDDTPDVFTASVEAHYILSDERHPKIVDSMLKMFSESENDLSRCEMNSWAMLNKFSSIAGLNLAMHTQQPENVISAARYVFDSYKKAVDSKRSDEVTQEILRDRIPRALTRNYIDYVDVGDGTFNIENGAITGPPVDKVPAHFISPLGFGPYLDSVIMESAEDIAKIARRSTLNHSLSGLSKESLPALPVAVHQVTQDGGEYSRRFFNVPGDDSPIPQECGERILTHIGNICVAKGGTYNITPSDRPERRVIIDGLAKDKIRAFNARADIDEQRESAIRQRQDANIARGASSTASMPARAPMPEPASDSEAAMMDFYYATGSRPKIRSTTTKSSRSTSTRVVETDVSKVAEEVKKCADGMKGVKGGDDSSTIATPGHSPIVSQVSHQEGRSNR
ncbi:Ankyrin repeats (3 copies) [Anaplasma phagocytophilum]|nr:Ankyrin repeats (3 copies) [Anaplasma phagocytophilum]